MKRKNNNKSCIE